MQRPVSADENGMEVRRTSDGDGRKMVVIEANEVPLRVIEDLAETGRVPFLAGLLDAGTLVETEVTEELPRELYPAQTWASLNTGTAYTDHGVYWYGDPKPAEFPFYWQTAARSGRSVGLVNTLHSSPVDDRCRDGDYRFVIPDCFSADDRTIPDRYRRFQRANIALTGANARRADLRSLAGQLVDLGRSLPSLGLRPRSAADLARLAAGVGLGRTPPERLRSGQFLLQRDLFLRLLDRRKPDLAVLFTNHVASSMHRYWYALYPEDFDQEHYSEQWVRRYRNEIPNAVELLDRFLGDLHLWCVANDRTVVLASSMGQGPSSRLRTDTGHEAVVADAHRFLEAMEISGVESVLGSMAPQLTLACRTPDDAGMVAGELADADVGQVFWDVDRADAVVTLTYQFEVVDSHTVRVGGVSRSAESMGVEVHQVDDHSSGRHIGLGILGVANSPTFKPPVGGVADHLHYAPALLSHLGLPPAEHQVMPQFQI